MGKPPFSVNWSWPISGWALRNRLHWSPRPWPRAACALEQFQTTLNASQLQALARLREGYPRLSSLRLSRPLQWQESLYVLDLLAQHLSPPTQGACLDVGCRNWAYLPGQWAWHAGPWDGIEIDPHRRYLDLTTRGAHAQATAADYDACRFITGSVETLAGPYTRITWFLPFVSPAPHRAWGLPPGLFQPLRLLDHVYQLLAPGGELLISNQGSEEAELQRDLLEQCQIPYTALGWLQSSFSPFQQPRFGWRVGPKPG